MLLLLLLFLLLSYLGDQIRKEYFFLILFEHFWEDQWWVAFVFAAVCAVHGGCTAFAIISKKPIDLFFLPYCWLRFFFFCFSSFHLSPAGGATANGFKCCLVWVIVSGCEIATLLMQTRVCVRTRVWVCRRRTLRAPPWGWGCSKKKKRQSESIVNFFYFSSDFLI